MVVFNGKITLKLGASAGDCETVDNVKAVSWKRMPQPSLTPQTVMNTTNPVGFYQGHKWVEIELQVLSEAYQAFYHNGTGNVAYIKNNADNVEIPYFVVTLVDSAGASWVNTFTKVLAMGPDEVHMDGETTIHVYRLVATKVAITPP